MQLKKLAFDFEMKEISDAGQFTGYASIFNNIDHGGDIVLPGAFKRSLENTKNKNKVIPILWQHNSSDPLGFYPEMVEDSKGLLVKGQLDLEVSRAREVKSLLKSRTISGLSIGYGTKKSQTNQDTGIRTLIDLDLHEVSLVTFPMNDEARVEAVKRRIEQGQMPKSIADFEKFLREAGFSKTNATIIANEGVKRLIRSESGSGTAKILEVLKDFKLPTLT